MSGLLSAIPYVASIGMALLLSFSSDRMRERKWHMLVPTFLAGVFMMAAAGFGHDHLVPLLACLTLTIALWFGRITTYWILVADSVPKDAAGASMAIANGVDIFGGFLGPFVFGWLRTVTDSFDAAMIFGGVAFALAAVIVMPMRFAASRPVSAVAAVVRGRELGMDNLTRRLATFAASLTYEQIPPEILRHARRSLIDTIGCAFGGLACEAAAIGRRIVEGAVPARHAGAVIGSAVAAPAEEAAFLNTVMIRYLDFNDAWHAGHPSDMLGALLALAGSSGADGRRLLTAMVVVYEVAFQMIPPTQMREKGWDQGYVIGIATTCGLGSLLGLPMERLAHAIAITSVANVPMRNTRAGKLSLWKGAATAFAIRNSVFATLLAADGMTGPDAPFEGRHGLWEQVTGPFELDPFGVDGGEWKFPWIRLKYWPVEYNAQAGVWAALRLRDEMRMEDIASVDIATYWSAWHEIGSEPRSGILPRGRPPITVCRIFSLGRWWMGRLGWGRSRRRLIWIGRYGR